MISLIVESGRTTGFGGRSPTMPMRRKRQQTELAQARRRLVSLYSRGRQSCESSEATEYSGKVAVGEMESMALRNGRGKLQPFSPVAGQRFCIPSCGKERSKT